MPDGSRAGNRREHHGAEKAGADQRITDLNCDLVSLGLAPPPCPHDVRIPKTSLHRYLADAVSVAAPSGDAQSPWLLTGSRSRSSDGAEALRERQSTAPFRNRERAGDGKLIPIRAAVVANTPPFSGFLDNGCVALAVAS